MPDIQGDDLAVRRLVVDQLVPRDAHDLIPVDGDRVFAVSAEVFPVFLFDAEGVEEIVVHDPAVGDLPVLHDDLRDLPHISYDLSAVCDTRSHYLLFKHEKLERLMFGSDNLIAGMDHGKYVTWGRGWTFQGTANVTHCDGRATTVVYEQLRCMKQAADMAGLSKDDVERIFWRNAADFFGFAKSDIK